MKKFISSSVLFIFCIVIIFFVMACHKDTIKPNSSTTSDEYSIKNFDAGIIVQANFRGTILTEQGQPVEGANVWIGDSKTKTDANGFFSILSAQVPNRASCVRVEKEGYFRGIRSIMVVQGSSNEVNIMLMPKESPSHFNSKSGGEIQVSKGGKIIFEPNSIIYNGTNTPYYGQVDVYARWIDPTDKNLSSILPGSLRGVDTKNIENVLTSYGMQAVELYDYAGRELQIAKGKTAEIHMTLPSLIEANAPENIPLWYLDENLGIWKEEGSAKKVSNEYVGKVEHFTFWNCDNSFPAVQLTAEFKTAGTPIPGLLIQTDNLNTPYFSQYLLGPGLGSTNSSGVVIGMVPQNSSFDLNAVSAYYYNANSSGTKYYTANIVTGTSNINLGTINFTAPNVPIIISGTFTDCNSNPIAGPVNTNCEMKCYYSNNSKVIFTNSSGEFSFLMDGSNLPPLPMDLRFHCIDKTNHEVTTQKFVIQNVGFNSLNPIAICGGQKGMLSYEEVDKQGSLLSDLNFQESYHIMNGYFNASLNRTDISCYNSNLPYLYFRFSGPDNINAAHVLTYLFINGNIMNVPPGTVVHLTEYGKTGEYIAGEFTYWDPATYIQRNVTFRIPR